jgi:hypothetical protein
MTQQIPATPEGDAVEDDGMVALWSRIGWE